MNNARRTRVNDTGKTERLCSRCKEWLELDPHYSYTRVMRPNGWKEIWQTYCRPCMSAYGKEWRGKNA